MKDCNFVDGKCTNCGVVTKFPNAKRHCKGPNAPKPKPSPKSDCKKKVRTPSKIRKAINFAGAITKDIANGMRRCTDEEMDERLKICRGSEEDGIPTCPLYVYIDENHGSCKACGCPMSRDHVYRNKIAWASEECPQGKWGRIQ